MSDGMWVWVINIWHVEPMMAFIGLNNPNISCRSALHPAAHVFAAAAETIVTWRSHVSSPFSRKLRWCLPLCHPNTATPSILYLWWRSSTPFINMNSVTARYLCRSCPPVWSPEHRDDIFRLHLHPGQRHRFVIHTIHVSLWCGHVWWLKYVYYCSFHMLINSGSIRF